MDYPHAAPDGFKALFNLQQYVEKSGLEHPLPELVKMRASQINGCAYCLDMHSKDARAAGETEQRLHALNAWRETPFYNDRERAALAWTEALTQIAHDQMADALYADRASSSAKRNWSTCRWRSSRSTRSTPSCLARRVLKGSTI